jgi:hypothetical protein
VPERRVVVEADLRLEVDLGGGGERTAGTVTSEDGHVVVEVGDPAVLLRALGPGGRRGSPLPALVPPGASGELRHRGRVLADVLPQPRRGAARVLSALVGDDRLRVHPALAGPLLRAVPVGTARRATARAGLAGLGGLGLLGLLRLRRVRRP